jgi:tRNA pseudouridine synthase 10
MGKHYRLKIKLAQPGQVDLSKVSSLIGEINQRTPKRVLRRRADIHRIREVYAIKVIQLNDEHLEAQIFCSGGLYVKELIHGDDGRTVPSLSQLLGNIKLEVEFLDVLNVEELAGQ